MNYEIMIATWQNVLKTIVYLKKKKKKSASQIFPIITT